MTEAGIDLDHGDVPPPTRREIGGHVLRQLPLLAVLVVLWIALWGAVSWLNLITGIVLAIVVTRFFYLPPIGLTGRLNLRWLAASVWFLLIDIVVASFQVAALAFRGVRTNSVIAVQLNSRSDLMTTLTAVAISLIPGSIVVEVDRDQSILYLHVLNTPDIADVEAARRNVLAVERRIVLAVGSADDARRAER